MNTISPRAEAVASKNQHAGAFPPVPGSVGSCPRCTRVLATGEHSYECRVCGGECCTGCSDTTARHPVVCDDCITAGYDDGWTQGHGDSPPNTQLRNDHTEKL